MVQLVSGLVFGGDQNCTGNLRISLVAPNMVDCEIEETLTPDVWRSNFTLRLVF